MGQLQQTLAQALLAFMTRDVVTVAVDGTLDFRPGSFSRNGGPRAISNGLTGSCMIPNPVMAWKRNAESIPEAEPMACRLQPSTASSAPTALITVSSAPTTLSSGIPLDGQARARTAAVIAGIQGEQSAAAALASVSSSSMAAASFAHAGIAAVLAGIQGAESAKAAIATISSSSMVAASLSHVGSGASGSATVAVTEQIASTSSTAAAATKHQTTRPTIATSTASVVLSPSPPPTWAVFLVYQIYTWTSIPPSTDYYNKIYLKNLSIDTAEPNFCASNSWIWNTQLEGEVEDVPPYPAGVLDFALPPGTVEKEEDGCTWKADSGPGDLKCSSFLKSVTCTNTETPALICPGVNPNRIVPLAKCVW